MNTNKLLGVVAELTYRCPLQCLYCYNPIEFDRQHRELPISHWKELFSEAKSLGALQVGLTGGEPLLYPGIEELITHLNQLGLYINLITSGITRNPNLLENLIEQGLQHVQFSIQDIDEDNAKNIAGIHVWEKKYKQILMLLKKNIAFTLNIVIHQKNINNLARMIDFAEQLGIKKVEIAHLQLYGHAKKNNQQLLLSHEQIKKSITIVQEKKELLQKKMHINFILPDYYLQNAKACMGGWGAKQIVVDPWGNVWPCHAASTIPDFPREYFQRGNLAYIWNDSKLFNQFRGDTWMKEPCASCEHRFLDFGGCRCQAYLATKDIAAPDPICSIVKNSHHKISL